MMFFLRKPAFAAALLVVTAAGWAPAADAPYQEVEHRKSWFSFLRPAKSNPADQLAFARALRDGGSLRRAGRHYRALVASWPSTAEASTAQIEYARMLDDAGQVEKAFEQYQVLIDKYAGRFPFEEIVQRQYDLALAAMNRHHAPWLFGGWTTPERAIPLLEQVVRNAPGWSRAAEARFRAAETHEQNGDFHEAAMAYAETTFYRPAPEMAREAASRRALCLYKLTRTSPNEQPLIEEAWSALNMVLRSHPDAPNAAELRQALEKLEQTRAASAFGVARYYDRHARTRDSARLAYERFLTRFPTSEWTAAAQERLQALPTAKESTTNETVSASP